MTKSIGSPESGSKPPAPEVEAFVATPLETLSNLSAEARRAAAALKDEDGVSELEDVTSRLTQAETALRAEMKNLDAKNPDQKLLKRRSTKALVDAKNAHEMAGKMRAHLGRKRVVSQPEALTRVSRAAPESAPKETEASAADVRRARENVEEQILRLKGYLGDLELGCQTANDRLEQGKAVNMNIVKDFLGDVGDQVKVTTQALERMLKMNAPDAESFKDQFDTLKKRHLDATEHVKDLEVRRLRSMVG